MTEKPKDPTEQLIIIEEKKTKPDGEVTVKKYIKGRFLGKVSSPSFPSNHLLGRVRQML